MKKVCIDIDLHSCNGTITNKLFFFNDQMSDAIFYKGIMWQLVIEEQIKISGKPKSSVKILL